MLISLARRAIRAVIILAAVLLPVLTGCVERRMTVRTNPPGALVYVDDYEIGATPISADFTYYGTRKIRIVKDGYETLTVMQPFPTPWYEVPPIDFITENFVPGKIRDQRVLDYQLKPQMIVPTDQLMSRAEGLRHNNMVVPAGATIPQPGGLAPAEQPTAPSTIPSALPGTVPGALPGTVPSPNSYPPPNTSIPPGAAIPPNTYQPPAGIGGQPIYELPPR